MCFFKIQTDVVSRYLKNVIFCDSVLNHKISKKGKHIMKKLILSRQWFPRKVSAINLTLKILMIRMIYITHLTVFFLQITEKQSLVAFELS